MAWPRWGLLLTRQTHNLHRPAAFAGRAIMPERIIAAIQVARMPGAVRIGITLSRLEHKNQVFFKFSPPTQRGSLAAPPCQFCCVVSEATLTARVFGRRAPRERCVQLSCSSKPGGVILPSKSSVSSQLRFTPVGGTMQAKS